MSENTQNETKGTEVPEPTNPALIPLIPAFEAKFAEVLELDKRLEAAKGTMAEIQRKGLDHANSVKMLDLLGSPEAAKAWQKERVVVFALKPDTTLEGYIKALQDEVSEAAMVVETVKNEWIRSNSTKDETDALRTRRAEAFNLLESFAKVIRDLDADWAESYFAIKVLPSAKAASTRTSGASAAKTGDRIIYTIDSNGKRKDNPPTYDISRVAFYQPIQATADNLREALKRAGWDGTETNGFGPYEVTVTDKEGKERTLTIGAEVVKSDKSDSTPEAEKSDNTDK